MKHLLPTLLALAFCSPLFAQNLQLGWGYTNGSTGADGANDLVVDAAGNTYVTGYFSGTVDFDKGPGIGNLSVPAGQTAKDAFVLKLDAQGNYVWAIRIGGTNNADQEGSKIALDTAGNIVVSGIFNGNLSLPPNATNYNASLTEVGSFMLKIDTAGTVLWGRAWAHATNEIRIEDFVIDSLNFIVAVGEFTGTVNFSTTATPNFKTSAGGKDFFIFKSGAAGHVQLVETGGNANDEYANAVEVVANQFWISGSFKGTVDFNFGSNTNNLTSNNASRDIFTLRLNAILNFVNVFQVGGSTDNDVSKGLKNWNTGFVYHYGGFEGSTDFDPSNAISLVISSPSDRPFIQKFDSQGNLIWVKVFQHVSNSMLRPIKIGISNSGELFLVMAFFGTVDLDPDTISTSFITSPSSNLHYCIVELDSNGVFQSSQILDAFQGYSRFGDLALSTPEDIKMCGRFNFTVDLDPGSNTVNVTPVGDYDMMILKLLSCKDTTVNITATACGSYVLSNGQTITQSGTYADTLQTSIGCDSILNINLTINPLPNTTIAWQGATLHVQNTSTANSYQWLDCTSGQAIAGATDSTFTPTANGSFAVVVNNGTCTDTSACETLSNFSIDESASVPTLVFPNPTTGLLHIESEQLLQKVEVLDVTGRLVFSQTQPNKEIDLSTLPKGVYLVKIYLEQGVGVQRILKM